MCFRWSSWPARFCAPNPKHPLEPLKAGSISTPCRCLSAAEHREVGRILREVKVVEDEPIASLSIRRNQLAPEAETTVFRAMDWKSIRAANGNPGASWRMLMQRGPVQATAIVMETRIRGSCCGNPFVVPEHPRSIQVKVGLITDWPAAHGSSPFAPRKDVLSRSERRRWANR